MERVTLERRWNRHANFRLDLPHVQKLLLTCIGQVNLINGPSIRALYLDTQDHSCTGFEKDPEGPVSKNHLPHLETLHIGDSNGFLETFTKFKFDPCVALLSGIRKLALDIFCFMKKSNEKPDALFFPLLFPKLETVQLFLARSEPSLDVKLVIEELSLFNKPSGQQIRRVEVYGPIELLHAAKPFLKFIPPGVEFTTVEWIRGFSPEP